MIYEESKRGCMFRLLCSDLVKKQHILVKAFFEMFCAFYCFNYGLLFAIFSAGLSKLSSYIRQTVP